jgi:hypothetical protein
VATTAAMIPPNFTAVPTSVRYASVALDNWLFDLFAAVVLVLMTIKLIQVAWNLAHLALVWTALVIERTMAARADVRRMETLKDRLVGEEVVMAPPPDEGPVVRRSARK